MGRITMTCSKCGGADVARDATARWNDDLQDWYISGLFDNSDCDDCGEVRLDQKPLPDARPIGATEPVTATHAAPKQWLFIGGNPVAGFTYCGPFASRDDAGLVADMRDDSDWWIVELHSPIAD